MFARADQLRVSELEDGFRLHAINYSWDGFEPALLIFDLDDGTLSNLELDSLDMMVSKRRSCVGSFVDDDYLPCPNRAPVTRFTQCPDCSAEMIAVQDCLFEPKCDGEMCDSPICRRDHVVYISFFGARPKIGMTLERRLRRRLIEQGADGYMTVQTLPSRRGARQRERELGEKLRLTERPATASVLSSLCESNKRRMIEEIAQGLSMTLSERFGIESGELVFLDDYPLEEPLDEVPQRVESWGMHSGAVVGIKGRFLIYRADRLQALALSELPARFISRERL